MSEAPYESCNGDACDGPESTPFDMWWDNQKDLYKHVREELQPIIYIAAKAAWQACEEYK